MCLDHSNKIGFCANKMKLRPNFHSAYVYAVPEHVDGACVKGFD